MGATNLRTRLTVIIFAIALTLICILSSCSYEKRLQKWCARCPQKETKSDSISVERDTTKKEITRIDTAWRLLPVPGPTVYVPSPCEALCDSNGKLKAYDKKAHKNGMTSHTYTKGDSLINDCNADSLMQVNKTREIYISTFEKVYRAHMEKLIIENQANRPTWWGITYRWGFWIMLILLLLSWFRKPIAHKLLGWINWP